MEGIAAKSIKQAEAMAKNSIIIYFLLIFINVWLKLHHDNQSEEGGSVLLSLTLDWLTTNKLLVGEIYAIPYYKVDFIENIWLNKDACQVYANFLAGTSIYIFS